MNNVTTKTATQLQVKTIDLKAKEWFDKVNGNSYFSAQAIINFGMPDEKTVYIPFDYGYGDFYIQAASHQLQTDGILPNDETIYSFTQWCRENNIILRYSKQDKCLKSEVKAFGSH